MGPLTEGKMLHAKKKRRNVRPKAPPPELIPIPVEYQRVKDVKKKIKHNKEMHSQASLCNIMSACLLFGIVGIIVAKAFGYLIAVYVISIMISMGAIYWLPKFKSVNITHANNMKHDSFIILLILWLGPIMTMFTLTILLLPPRKKGT